MTDATLHLLVQTFDYSPDTAGRTFTTDVHLKVERTLGFSLRRFILLKVDMKI